MPSKSSSIQPILLKKKKCFFFRFLAHSYHVYIDENGDAAGNYTILALKKDHRQDNNLSMAYGLYPIGTFGLPDSNQIPVSYVFHIFSLSVCHHWQNNSKLN